MRSLSIQQIGLTGGIGSGKSTVAKLLADMGVPIVDADALSKDLTATDGAAMPIIEQTFGRAALNPDGSLNREHMRQRVFQDPQARQQLEAILHPLVGQRMQDQVAQAQALGAQCVVLDIPLLAESRRWPTQLDRILVVDCEPATQIRRVQARNGLSQPQIQAIMAQQASREQRRAVADWVIYNQSLDMTGLRQVVQALPLKV